MAHVIIDEVHATMILVGIGIYSSILESYCYLGDVKDMFVICCAQEKIREKRKRKRKKKHVSCLRCKTKQNGSTNGSCKLS